MYVSFLNTIVFKVISFSSYKLIFLNEFIPLKYRYVVLMYKPDKELINSYLNKNYKFTKATVDSAYNKLELYSFNFYT
jgi:hypothetical protein